LLERDAPICYIIRLELNGYQHKEGQIEKDIPASQKEAKEHSRLQRENEDAEREDGSEQEKGTGKEANSCCIG